MRQLKTKLERPPSFDRSEKTRAPVIRRHCALRLQRYYRPTTRHLMFAEQFGMLLREGYMGRNPQDRRHEALVIDVAGQARDGTLLGAARPILIGNTASAAVLIGMPGMGKTLAVNEVLASYPQVIAHEGMPAQIVWLKLETPPRGSLRALCVDFFHQVDALLGQETYTRLYAGSNASEDTMMTHMALVASRHALGCLVIDEIQHLPKGDGEDHALMTFLVTLTNKMGVPVLFIGTMSAQRMFERTGRMARRSVGLACGIWENYSRKDGDAAEWKNFLDDLWQYQWTFGVTALQDDLRETIYDLSQGVVDLAVKLFMLVQMRVILRTDGKPEYPELIDARFMREVWSRDFKPVHELTDALRSGDRARIAKFDDLAPFHAKFGETMRQLAEQQAPVELSRPQRRFDDEIVPAPADLVEQAVRADLQGRGMAPDMVDTLIAEAKADFGETTGRLGAFMAKVEKLLGPGRKKSSGPKEALPENLIDGDLRQLAREAARTGRTVCEVLTEAGIGGRPALSLAA